MCRLYVRVLRYILTQHAVSSLSTSGRFLAPEAMTTMWKSHELDRPVCGGDVVSEKRTRGWSSNQLSHQNRRECML